MLNQFIITFIRQHPRKVSTFYWHF